MELKRIGILLFDDVELLDFAGPLQVFSGANYVKDDCISLIEMVGDQSHIKTAKSNLKIEIQRSIEEEPTYDLFLIPGGMGTRSLIKDEALMQKIDAVAQKSKMLASVCTGSLVLAKLGFLKNKSATTHYAATDLLTKLDPTITVDRSKRYIDHGKIVIAEGVSAGIDMSFHILSKHFSQDLSDTVRKYIEYYPDKP